MYWIEGFGKVIKYIEENLDASLDYEHMADILGYSTYHFQRLFMVLSGLPLSEYIRNRRLSEAAVELQAGQHKVIDVAFKYGYSSPTSFNRAFKSLHGITPSEASRHDVLIKAFPPLSFDLKVIGAETINYRIAKMDAFRIVGKCCTTTVENGQCYRDIPAYWEKLIKSGGPGSILSLRETQPTGLLGVSDYNPEKSSTFNYYIATSSSRPAPEGMAELNVPAATWAIFPHIKREPASIQAFQKRILMEWLPTSGFEFAKAPDIERYDDEGGMETWIPVIQVKSK
jgi:AraC family transcriptional regulator